MTTQWHTDELMTAGSAPEAMRREGLPLTPQSVRSSHDTTNLVLAH